MKKKTAAIILNFKEHIIDNKKAQKLCEKRSYIPM